MALLAIVAVLVLLPALALAEAHAARRRASAALGELRALRLQVGNVLGMLQAAGFKPPRRGWEDDWQKTQLRDSSPPEVSWMRQTP